MKTETFSPQNNHTTELNVNFLLTTTVYYYNITNVPPVFVSKCTPPWRVLGTSRSVPTKRSIEDIVFVSQLLHQNGCLHTSFLVVPGVPLDITASEISRSIDNVCIILVQWGPPTNSDASDIAKYIVYISSRNIERTVSAAPPTFTTLPIMNCGDDARVQIAAVNRIGCVGMNSSEVPPTLRDVPTVPTDNGSATTEGGSTSTSSK